MKRISLEELLGECGEESYLKQYEYICGLLEKQAIKEVKSSPLNGKTPALHLSYWVMEAAPDYRRQMEELMYEMVPAIVTDYYLSHPDVYKKEQKWVKLLNRFFLEQGEAQLEPVSLNERSFQIWGREKFLQREQGRKILAHCGVPIERLKVYGTTEPLAYYSGSRKMPQTILILENKDTFYSMRRFLLGGGDRIFGEEIGTVIYGAGKGILRSFEDFEFCMEPHINDCRNQILYFGDLDYEGIGIYERLEENFRGQSVPMMKPFVRAYEKMLEKSREWGMDFLPDTSENQNRGISGHFFSYFGEDMRKRMEQVLQAGKYIPQEILMITDLQG